MSGSRYRCFAQNGVVTRRASPRHAICWGSSAERVIAAYLISHAMSKMRAAMVWGHGSIVAIRLDLGPPAVDRWPTSGRTCGGTESRVPISFSLALVVQASVEWSSLVSPERNDPQVTYRRSRVMKKSSVTIATPRFVADPVLASTFASALVISEFMISFECRSWVDESIGQEEASP